MNIREFLEARIAEDEEAARIYAEGLFDSARVLAECAAKRAIIAQAKYLLASGKYDGWRGTGEAILRLLAAVYVDHPDYQGKWG